MTSKIIVSGITDPALAAAALKVGADMICVLTNGFEEWPGAGWIRPSQAASFAGIVPREKLIIGWYDGPTDTLLQVLEQCKASAAVLPDLNRGKLFGELTGRGVLPYELLTYESPAQLNGYAVPDACAGVWLRLPERSFRGPLAHVRERALSDFALAHTCILSEPVPVTAVALNARTINPYAVDYCDITASEKSILNAIAALRGSIDG